MYVKPTLLVLGTMYVLAAILATLTSSFTNNTFLIQAQGGQGMSGMGGMMEHSAPGSVNQVCSVEDHMPPHYCEPSYQVMSSVKGVKITDVTIVNDTSIVLTVRELNPTSNNTVGDIVIVGGGGDLAGSSLLDGNWNESTTAIINFVGTGSVYSTDRLMIHLFPFSEQT